MLFAVLVGLDSLAALFAWTLAYSVVAVPSRGVGGVGHLVLTLALSAITLVMCATQALYRARTSVVRSVETLALLRASASTGVVALAAGQVFESITLAVAVTGAVASFVTLRLGRSAFTSWVAGQRRRGHFVRSVILIGANEEAARIAGILRDHPEVGYSIAGVAGDRDEYQDAGFVEPWVGPVAAALFAARAQSVTGCIIAPTAVDAASSNRLAREMLAQGFHVQMTSGLSRVDQRRLRVQHMMHEPIIYVEPANAPRWARIAKRAIDVVVAGTTLVFVAPVLAAVALAVRLSSPGPIIFRQQRVGRHGELFTVYKFRTMVADAEDQLEELIEHNQRSGPLFKLARDPRVTPMGGLLRKTSLDELPQLFNVLHGEMSLVGPRPALETEVAEFDDELRGRLSMLPGITGLWQIEARDNPSFDAYRRLDLFYVENWSIGLDLVILGRTAFAVGARALRMLLPRRRGDVSMTATLD